jgi:hypothetical protein
MEVKEPLRITRKQLETIELRRSSEASRGGSAVVSTAWVLCPMRGTKSRGQLMVLMLNI